MWLWKLGLGKEMCFCTILFHVVHGDLLLSYRVQL